MRVGTFRVCAQVARTTVEYDFALGLFIFVSHVRCSMYLRMVRGRDLREVGAQVMGWKS